MKRFYYVIPPNAGAHKSLIPFKPYKVESITHDGRLFFVKDESGELLCCRVGRDPHIHNKRWIIPGYWVPRRILMFLAGFYVIGCLRYLTFDPTSFWADYTYYALALTVLLTGVCHLFREGDR